MQRIRQSITLTMTFFLTLMIALTISVHADTQIFTEHEIVVDYYCGYFTLDFIEDVTVEKVTSSNSNVVSVDQIYNSFVYLYTEDPGTAVITATDSEGNQDTCTVTVKPPEFYVNESESIFSDYLQDGESDHIYASNAIKSISSSDKRVAMVELSDHYYVSITPSAAGKATLTLKDIYGQTCAVNITVTQKYIDDSKYLEDISYEDAEMVYGDTELELHTYTSGASAYAEIAGRKYTTYSVAKDSGIYYLTIKNLPVMPAGTAVKYTLKKGESVYTNTIKIEKCDLGQYAYVDFNYEDKVYKGKAYTPAVRVIDIYGISERVLVPGRDYTLTYSNNKNVGTATITVNGIGNYTGVQKDTFKILPKKTKFTKVLPEKKGFTVKWKKQTKQTSGYQIQYSLKSDFSKARTVKIKKNKTTSKKIKKLKSKKKYYVRIRTYKIVKGTYYYSDWSTEKSVKTR